MRDELSIKDVAETFDVTKRTIRYYEEIGLIRPERNLQGRRMFSPGDLTRIRLIFRGKKYGFHLEEIKEMIELFDQDPSGVSQLERTMSYGREKMQEVDIRIRELLELKKEMEAWMERFEQELRERRGETL
ncbi:MerR family transcriptional regulator [Halobacillus kuroshimensis]|uniref:MerR family transcriptional regulator n=1 Tax=Halobacillus kuroshimensis TaxID=302481 RepID=UPI00041410D3|nr:MerR family transcriptional regulator [Halobacillus kuroshimensis]